MQVINGFHKEISTELLNLSLSFIGTADQTNGTTSGCTGPSAVCRTNSETRMKYCRKKSNKRRRRQRARARAVALAGENV